ncbi:hypothetical protein FDN13_02780 [Caloramator sp. E03]|uniref:hypothetical protein n=1 Tax=Caloramator sp. E03 TaxID=2576307 RepID=UPI0011100EDA|nr:hypothetical protein [Caloramator sp. E03]QCX32715.1 hypothetical protein FDN13_02780 [Caloramator sp. E03]
MKRKGYSLIETLIAAMICSFITIYMLDFISYNNIFLYKIEDITNIQENMNIAADFLYENIIKSNDIRIEDNNFFIDGKRVYIKNNILRFDTDSQQIASGITKIQIKKMKDRLYTLTLYFGSYSNTFYVLSRGDFYD